MSQALSLPVREGLRVQGLVTRGRRVAAARVCGLGSVGRERDVLGVVVVLKTCIGQFILFY